MQLQAHFKNIQNVIIEHLQSAESEILVAVAWFTDREIFEVLCQKAQVGVHVSVFLLGDDINKAPTALSFQRLINLGGKVTFLPSGSDGAPMMHHKFCVLDGRTVITGSYNWSKKAQSNDENITVVTEAPDFSTQYRQAFHELTGSGSQEDAALLLQVNSEAIRRRLEMVRNLILLGEQEDLPPHIKKLHPVAEALQLHSILKALEQGAYKDALEAIELYLKRSSALVLHEDINAPKLQFQLKVLELRLQSLSDEKSDLERALIIFNRRYNDALGTLLIELLKAETELAQRKAKQSQQRAEQNQEAEQEAEQDKQHADQAEQDWHDYQQEYEQQQGQDAPSHLNNDEEAELKILYRKTRTLCHPDKFADGQKEGAHQIFVELQDVYKKNDLSALRELYTKLKTGSLFKAPRSSTLSRFDALRVAIAELEHRITDILFQIQQLHSSEGADLLRMAGDTESDWLVFFSKQEQLLQAELQQLKQGIALYNTEDNN